MRRDTIKHNTVSLLDHYLNIIKKVSVISSLITCVGLGMLYFCGIAIFTSMSSAFGVPPFEFTLQKCLEYGSIFFSQILAIIPLLLLLGLKNYIHECNLQINIMLALPVVSMFAISFINSRSQIFKRRFLSWTILLTLAYMLLYLLVVYWGMVSTLVPSNLLLDPAVNIALQHKAELQNDANLSKFGINHWNIMTMNTVIKDSNWKFEKIGIIFMIMFISAIYSYIVIIMSGKIKTNNECISPRFIGIIYFMRRLFILTFSIFMAASLFIFAGRTSVLISTISAQKVDIDIPSMNGITSKYYAIVIGEYDNDYVFYFPSIQQLLKIQKNKVENILFKGETSIFANRYHFTKGPWLGVYGDFNVIGSGKNVGNKDKKIDGFKVTEVFLNSPAYKFGIIQDDVITTIDEIAIDGSMQLSEIVKNIPSGKDVQIIIRRGGMDRKISGTIENKP